MATTTDDVAQDRRLVQMLGDAAVGAIWAALLLAALLYISWAAFVAARTPLLEVTAGMWGVSVETVAVLWIAAVALIKLIAMTLFAVAFGLWVWRRRVVRRLGAAAKG